jgi:tripeptide aminopeptidase
VIDAADLAEFAAIPAPTGCEGARLAWLEKRLSGVGGSLARDGVGNLVWRAGSSGAPKLLVMAHVDTVFAGMKEIHIVREGDDLVGPGIGDNATAVMAAVWVLERLPAPPDGLCIAFTVGEEGLGNLRGALHACRELGPEMAIAVEGHGLEDVVIDHVGSVRARVSARGPGGHSWSDRGTPSAIHALLPLGARLAQEGANIGTISGGQAVNAIAAEAEMLVDRRSLDQAELDAFEAEVTGLSVEPPLALEIEIVGRRPAGRTGAEEPLVRTILKVRRSLGLAEHWGSGSTDANAAAGFGIPAVSIGCTRGSGMHTVHERIELGPLEQGCRQLEAVIGAVLA